MIGICLAPVQKHQREVSALQELLRERTKENRRLKSSFDTIKELNDTMKKQARASRFTGSIIIV